MRYFSYMTQPILPKQCPACEAQLQIEQLRCERCDTRIAGKFALPRLARLPQEDQQFIELLVMHEGSLKAVAASLEISYPTLRKRLEEVVQRLENEAAKDQTRGSAKK